MPWRSVRSRWLGRQAAAVAGAGAMFFAVYLTARQLLPGLLTWVSGHLDFILGQEVVDWARQLGAFGMALTAAGWVWQACQQWAAKAKSSDQPAERLRARLADERALAYAARELGKRLLIEYGEQERRHGVSGAVPLTVAFSSTRRPAALRGAVVGEDGTDAADVGDWRQSPLQGDVHRIARVWREQVPRRRLVILGAPGAGKTVLALTLCRQLLARPEDGEPVPVLLPISSWDPAVESVAEFLVRRLAEDFPFLAERSSAGTSVAERLVNEPRTGRPGSPPGAWLLPVLDGLDELPAGRHGRAVTRVDDYAHDHPVVVTCRGREYSMMVVAARRVIGRAAVIEIQAVSAVDAVSYLAGPEHVQPLWEPVLDDVRGNPTGPLARTLNTPLTVSLARSAYQRQGTVPAELTRLPTRREVIGRLVDMYVEFAYEPGKSPYELAKVRRWLGCLAYHGYRSGTRDLVVARVPLDLLARGARRRLWSIIMRVLGRSAAARAPRWWQQLVLGLLAGLAAGLVVSAPVFGAAVGLVCGGVAAAVPRLFTDSRRAAVRFGLLAAAVFGVTASADPTATHLVSVAAAAVTFGVAAGVRGAWRSWVPHRLALLRLAVLGWLPFRLSAFLEDAYGRGVLRRNGTVWQFRHAFLQDHFYPPVREYDLARTSDNRYLGQSWAKASLRNGDLDQLRDLTDRRRAQDSAGPLAELLAVMGNLAELRHRAASGWEAAARFADVLVAQESHAEAVRVIRRWAVTGRWAAAVQLGDVLREQGTLEAAIADLRSPDARRGPFATEQLAVLLWKHGDLAEAASVIHSRAQENDDAAELEAIILAKAGDAAGAAAILGRIEQARPAVRSLLSEQLRKLRDQDGLRRRADAGDADAARELAVLLFDHGRVDEAVAGLRQRADGGDWRATRELVGVLRRLGELDEAVAVLRIRADDDFTADKWYVTRELIDVLLQQDDVEAAVAVLESQSKAWAPEAALEAADLLQEHGAVDAAVDALRPLVSTEPSVGRRLGDLLRTKGDLDGAAEVLQTGVEQGDVYSARALAAVLREKGDTEAALSCAAEAAREDWTLVPTLAQMLRERGEMDKAIDLLRKTADHGDWAATRDLATLLLEQGRATEAAALLRPLAEDGHREAAEQLANLPAPSVSDLYTLVSPIWDKAVELAKAHSYEEAWHPSIAAITLLRALAIEDRAEYLPDLGAALYNHSVILDEQELHLAALAYSGPAVEVYREVCAADPGIHRLQLAGALANHAAVSARAVRAHAARDIAQEAVTVYRALAAEDPDAHKPDLASGLWNATWVDSVLDIISPEALALATETVEIYEELARSDPETFDRQVAKARIEQDTITRRLGLTQPVCPV
jgi:tetratricopeptide (TPR) repeat protein